MKENEDFDLWVEEARLIAYIMTHCAEKIPAEESVAFFVKLSVDLVSAAIKYASDVEEIDALAIDSFERIRNVLGKVIDREIESRRERAAIS